MKLHFLQEKIELVQLSQSLEKDNIVDTYHVMKGQDFCIDSQGICLGILLMKSEYWVYTTEVLHQKKLEMSHLGKILQSQTVQCRIYLQNK